MCKTCRHITRWCPDEEGGRRLEARECLTGLQTTQILMFLGVILVVLAVILMLSTVEEGVMVP